MRLFLGLLSAQSFKSTLTGDDSLNRRPMNRVMDPFRERGVHFEVEMVKAKRLITVCGLGGFEVGLFRLPVASAQLKSAFLLAGLHSKTKTIIEEPSQSRAHTERILQAMGANLVRDGNRITLTPGQSLKPLPLEVPGDFSSAAFLIAAALITPDSEVKLPSVGMNPTRKTFIDVAQKMGGIIKVTNSRNIAGEPVADLEVKSSVLKGVDVGGDMIPKMIDEIPIFAVLASAAKGTSMVRNAEELRFKESDRIATVCIELKKLGVTITEKPDGFIIEGGRPFQSGRFQSHGDHRIAMSMSVASLAANKPSTIENTDCISTSFPGFFDVLKG